MAKKEVNAKIESPKETKLKKENAPEEKMHPPLLITKKDKPKVTEVEKPITQDDVDAIMKRLGPQLKNPETNAAATIELEKFHKRWKNQKTTPQW